MKSKEYAVKALKSEIERNNRVSAENIDDRRRIRKLVEMHMSRFV